MDTDGVFVVCNEARYPNSSIQQLFEGQFCQKTGRGTWFSSSRSQASPPASKLISMPREPHELHWPHMLITDYNNRKAECLSMKLCLFEQFDIYSVGLLESVHGNWMPASCLRGLLHHFLLEHFSDVNGCCRTYWLNALKTVSYGIVKSGWGNDKWVNYPCCLF